MTNPYKQLKEVAADKDADFEKNWNSRFSWFTKDTCSKITTIHGESDSRTVSFLGMFLCGANQCCT
jgi:hypothetical protein